LKRIKNILKNIIIFAVVFNYQLLIKIIGFNFCVNSIKKDLFNLRIDPKYLSDTLNSKFLTFLKPSCLAKSLTFKKLIKKPNKFILIIGVAKIKGVFQSHAWIEKDENIILNSDPNIRAFKKIFTYE
tara:strand:+ start:2226 stop:2606 length:381 start_codon:yes stop_codon:yes gene_type:complete